LAKVEGIAKNDPYRTVRAEAIDLLATTKDAKYKDFFIKSTTDSSYSVAGAALEALSVIDSSAALSKAKELSSAPAKGRLSSAISGILIKYGDESSFDFIEKSFNDMPVSQAKFQTLKSFSDLLVKIKDPAKFKKGIDDIAKFRDAIPEAYKVQTTPFIDGVILKGIATKKGAAGEKELADYATSKIGE
jgi:aminopeptidase N